MEHLKLYVSIVVVVSTLILQLIFSLVLKDYIDLIHYEVLAKLYILIILGAGLAAAYYSNRDIIQKRFQKKRINDNQRIKYKFVSFLIGYSTIWFFSWAMVNIFDYDLYTAYYYDALFFSPIICIVFYGWIKFLDSRSPEPEDEYYHLTKALVERKFEFRQHKPFLLLYLVKIFYIPFMYGAVVIALVSLFKIEAILSSPLQFIKYLFIMGLCFDVCIGIGGYLFSSQFFNTETKSVEDSILGWLVCLICYPPLLSIYRFFTQQVDHLIWTDWLQMQQPLYWLWAFLITLTWVCYWLATMSFGFRFSNLSWRGLIDSGLYKYTKHPAYLSKNIYWWLHTVPFFGVMGLDMLRNFMGLSIVSLIYYLRAKTEERHLMRFPEYREYCLQIEQKGIYAKIKKWTKH